MKNPQDDQQKSHNSQALYSFLGYQLWVIASRQSPIGGWDMIEAISQEQSNASCASQLNCASFAGLPASVK
jgi:hypothetical protein